MAILWLILALVIAFALVAMAARRTRRLLPALELPPGETFPATPLQRLATRSLAAAAGLTAIAAGIVIVAGPQRFWDDDAVRLTVTGLTVLAVGMGALPSIRARRWASAEDGQLDERDRTILTSASGGQAGAILVTVAAWMIGLTESFPSAGAVPVVYLYLMFWSSLLVSLLAWLGGVVLAYRRS
jgi:hypothetical protein